MSPRLTAVDSAHRFVVAYDIANDQRRARIAKIMESYGDRVQYSVFIVDIKPARLVRLRSALDRAIDPGGDSVIVCDLGPLSHGGLTRISYLGLPRTITGQAPLIL